MGIESFGGNYDIQQTNEGANEQVVSSLNDSRREIGDKALKYYEANREDPERVQNLQDFMQRQEQERLQLKEQLEAPVLSETREELDRQAMINEAKTMLYEQLGISENLGDNNWGENFGKGLVDTLVLDNYDLAIQIWETKGTVITDAIAELLSSWENIKKMAEALGESILGIFSGDGYETGKSVAELGLITTGVGVGVYAGRKAFKLGMKQISKLRQGAEKVVESQSVKQVVSETTSKIDEIVPKEKVDVRGEVLANLPENIRNLDLELDNYSPQQLEGLKQRLGLDSKSTIDDIDLTYRLKLKDTLDRYRELSDINLARFGREILEELKKSGDTNPLQTLENEILRLEMMKGKGELLVVSAISGDVYKSGVQYTKFSYLDSLDPDVKAEITRKSNKYMQLRESTELGIGSYGLEPKYSSFLIKKGELSNISDYGDDNIRFIGYTIDELEGRAGVTLYDSMLSGRIGEVGTTTQMLEYTSETLIKAKAIYNIDESLGFPIHERLKGEAISANNGQMSRFFLGVKPYVEVHIYGGNSGKVKEALTEQDFINKHFTK